MLRHIVLTRATGLCLALVVLASVTVFATPTDDLIDTNDEIASLQRELDVYQSQLDSEVESKDLLQMESDELQAQIDVFQAQVAELDAQIRDVEDELDAAETEFADMLCAYTARIRTIEEYGTSSYWAILFQSTSLVDLLGRLDYVEELMQADETAMALVDNQIADLDGQREQLESLIADRKYAATQLKYTQNELSKCIEEKIAKIQELNYLTSSQKEELERLQAEASMLRALAADDSNYSAETADTIYYKYISEPGYDKQYPKGSAAVRGALKWLGARYVWGGETPAEGGFDCSGLMWYVYKNLGYELNRVGTPQYYYDGEYVQSQEELQPGDMIFFKNTYKLGISHVGMYISNGVFVHAANPKAGIKISSLYNNYWASRYVGAKRIVDE